ncbi:GNAT family N-acetyltransferase [Marinobacter sp. X15-166B]|uniref:GNAT family N-acetyltransferase n=1 Tax=Marinobacter sp. X15-166B TaxID=1897620 RepID=UPI00085BD8AF|nr:GNAT family N-acetyltransferase [Marinobacter sp. X15-166B]OEY65311.1 GNAT family N-acetyltransferase [Marinobacter sp. X15-166B]
MTDIEIRTLRSIHDIDADSWDRFSGSGNPFLCHRFLAALETTGCTTRATGWQPSHLLFYRRNRLVGVAPAYLKSHSMGEYVFDWAWADAYRRHDLAYYPKLLIAVPFTPSVGGRLLLAPELRAQLGADTVHRALDRCTTRLGAHSWHLLFPNRDDQRLLHHPDRLHRIGCQFHWHNRGYASFEDFLATLTSRRRKSIRRERRQVSEQGIGFTHYRGAQTPDAVLAAFYTFYQATYLKRGQRPYLNLEFFRELRTRQPEHLHLVMAEKAGELIAGALFLLGDDTLYGRYWGCLAEYDHLHFETCYYQGIELAIARKLNRFDAGAQGEHKLIRGFEPVLTHSWHWVAHPGFHHALTHYTADEAEQVRAYQADALTVLPYRQDTA